MNYDGFKEELSRMEEEYQRRMVMEAVSRLSMEIHNSLTKKVAEHLEIMDGNFAQLHREVRQSTHMQYRGRLIRLEVFMGCIVSIISLIVLYALFLR